MTLTLRLCAALSVCAATTCSVSLAHAESRVALVIGNGAYQNVAHLPNPVNDANLVANALKQDGFVVTLANDLDRTSLANMLRTFGHQADNTDWAIIYYAGHGMEMAGINYLVPVDAKLETDRDVGLEAVPLDQVMSAIEGARALRLVILDACRDDPFAATIKRTNGAGRDIGRGLARVEPAQATLVAYSAKDGSIARDGDGADSPYAIALAKHLIEPGVEVDRMFRLVHDDVEDATGRNQEPFVYGSLPGRQEFYFLPPTVVATAAPPNGAIRSDIASDEAAWQRIAKSRDPIDFDSFVRIFPESAHRVEAESIAGSLRVSTKPESPIKEASLPASDTSSAVVASNISDQDKLTCRKEGDPFLAIDGCSRIIFSKAASTTQLLEAYVIRAESYKVVGRVADAASDLRSAIEMSSATDPWHVAATDALDDINRNEVTPPGEPTQPGGSQDELVCRKGGDPLLAIDGCSRMITSKSTNNSQLFKAYVIRAQAYRALGRLDDALSDLHAALRGSSETDPWHIAAANELREIGRN